MLGGGQWNLVRQGQWDKSALHERQNSENGNSKEALPVSRMTNVNGTHCALVGCKAPSPALCIGRGVSPWGRSRMAYGKDLEYLPATGLRPSLGAKTLRHSPLPCGREVSQRHRWKNRGQQRKAVPGSSSLYKKVQCILTVQASSEGRLCTLVHFLDIKSSAVTP